MSLNSEFLAEIKPVARKKIAARLGGQQIRVPMRAETLLRQVPSLTEEEARQVIAAVGDCVVYVPSRDRRLARDSRIRVLRANGTPVRKIAAEVGLTAQRVLQILRAHL